MSPMNRNCGALIGFALLCSGALTTGSAAAAAPDPAFKTVNVRYSRAELERTEGAERLYHRIQSAARQACGEPDQRELESFFRARQCYQLAVDTTVAKIDARTLTALHRTKTQRTAPG
ncbi:MAG: UrcA family protein [Steroidobacteraceae bacterium]